MATASTHALAQDNQVGDTLRHKKWVNYNVRRAWDSALVLSMAQPLIAINMSEPKASEEDCHEPCRSACACKSHS